MIVPSHTLDTELIMAARDARQNAYAPYSQFAVGAAARLIDGSILTGANFENASIGLSLCAETALIASLNSAGRLTEIAALAVAGGPVAARPDMTAQPVTPCGRCRQILAEAASLAGRDFPVYCADASGEQGVAYTVAQLLPHAFSAAAFSRGQDSE